MKDDYVQIRNIDLINSIVAASGTILCLAGILGGDFWLPDKSQEIKTVFISVGCSLIASSIVSYFTSRYQMRRQRIKNIIDYWGLTNIFDTRSVMNIECDIHQGKAKKNIDIMAFGLSSWRQNCNAMIVDRLKHGVKIRILAPQPFTKFVKQREIDEEKQRDSISHDIELLEKWANDLKLYGDIELRYYSCLPLDFYFRVDNTLYIGPYLYGKQSQQTISYEFSADGKLFKDYVNYFEYVWNTSGETSSTNYEIS